MNWSKANVVSHTGLLRLGWVRLGHQYVGRANTGLLTGLNSNETLAILTVMFCPNYSLFVTVISTNIKGYVCSNSLIFTYGR